jgi:hypothetical protein
MKNPLINIFRLLFLILSVFIGYSIVKSLKENKLVLKDRHLDSASRNDENNKEMITVIKEKQEEKKIEKPSVKNDHIFTFRQQKILNILKGSQIVEMRDLQKSIKDVTERTLRRDLIQLQGLGLIKKIGNTKSVKYQLLKK